KKILQVKNRVTHELAGTMVGDVTPPVDAVKGGLAVSQSALVQQQMVRLSAFSQRIDMRMLDKKQIIVGGHLRFRRQASVFDLALHGAAKQFLLIIPGFFVIFQSK